MQKEPVVWSGIVFIPIYYTKFQLPVIYFSLPFCLSLLRMIETFRIGNKMLRRALRPIKDSTTG
jgi:hypothetical protein